MKRLRLLLVVSGLLLGLSACGGGDSSPAVLKPLGSSQVPSVAATASSTTQVHQTSTPLVVAAVPALPPAAHDMTSDGAQAFATYYIATLDRAVSSGDTQKLRALSDPGCGGCQEYISSIDRFKARHETVDGVNGLRVRFAVAPAVEDSETVVLLNLDGDEYVRRAADGSVVSRQPALVSVPHEMRCIWRNGVWVAAGLRRVFP